MSKKYQVVVNFPKAEAEPVEILVHGPIGQSFWSDDGITGKNFTDELNKIPKGRKITVGVNSQGGNVSDGLAIYNAIARRKDDITARIDGYAVSIASVFPLAAARVVSPKSSIWMIHKAWNFAQGNADQLRKDAEMLDVHDETLVNAYVAKTGKDADEVRAAMEAETWMDGAKAIEWGLADEESANPVALDALDFSAIRVDAFKNVPAAIFAAVRQSPAALAAGGNSATNPPPAAGAVNTNPNPTKQMDPNNTTIATPPAPAPAPAAPAADNNIIELTSAVRALVTAMNQPKPEPKPETGAAPLATGARVISQGLNDLLKTKGNPRAQHDFLAREWNQLMNHYPLFPQGANTDSAAGALTTTILSTGVMTTLQSTTAALSALLMNFTAGRVGRNVIEVPHVTAGGTAQSNPTNFEDTTNFVSTVTNVAITPAHIVAGAHLTNAELQNGWQMSWFAKMKAAELAIKIKALVNAIITTANFTADPLVSAYAAFGASDLKTLWGQLKKAPGKNIILDGQYFAQFLPATLDNYDVTKVGMPGWEVFVQDDYWTGATANTVGFACNPQAIGGSLGLPMQAPNSPGAGNLSEDIITLESNGMQVANYMWFNPAGRVMWWTLEVMAGFAKGDGTAGVLVKSS